MACFSATVVSYHRRRVQALCAAVLFATLLATASVSPALANSGGARFTILDTEKYNEPSALFFTPTCNARLEGVIYGPDPDDPNDKGDAARLALELKTFEDEVKATRHQGTKGRPALCLSSPGGDLLEALRIAEVFKGWMMVVEDGADCISACSIVFMSAKPRDGLFRFEERNPGRFLHYSGRLGFHAPVLNFPPSRAQGLTPEQVAQEAQKAYADALARMRDLAFPSSGQKSGQSATAAKQKDDDALDDRMRFLGSGSGLLPPGALLAFLVVPHEQMLFVDTVELAMSWNIEVFGFAKPPRLTRSMLAMACTNIAAMQCLKSPNEECGEDFSQAIGSGKAMTDERNIFRTTAALNMMLYGGSNLWPHSNLRTTWPQPKQAQKQSKPPENPGPFDNRILKADDPKLLIQVHELVDQSNRSQCDIRAIFDQNRLLELQIDIVDGRAAGQRRMLELEGYHPQEKLVFINSAFRLRPWKMLQAPTKLSSLGGPNPWGWLVEGNNYFSRPPNW